MKKQNPEFAASMNASSNIKKVIGVVSGKGGVGKSFLTSYLAVSMNRRGLQSAVLDADITGPSIPKAFGIHERAKGNDLGMYPAVSGTGIRIMSANLLLEEEETPVIWRGAMISNTVKQFWSDVVWGEVDVLFVDMPPGTGDVPLTVFQSLPVDGIIIVTSPQELVSMIVAKAVGMAKAMDIPVLGLVENYSYMVCPHCKEKLHPFGESHLKEVAAHYGLPVLGELPLDPELAKAVDQGMIEGITGDWLEKAVDAVEQCAHVVQETQEEKIAIPVDDKGKVTGNLEEAKKFYLYPLEEGTVTGREEFQWTPEQGTLSETLAKEGVVVILCGMAEEETKNKLKEQNISLAAGAMGSAEVVLALYLDGTLKIQE